MYLPLIQFVFPMEDSLARKFSFLMIELYLRTFQPEKALNLLTVAEKLILGNAGGGSGGLKSANQSPPQETGKIIAAAADKVASPPTSSSSSSNSSDEELWKTRLSLYRARSYMMLHSMKPCKREMKTLMSSGINSQAAIYLKSYFAYSARERPLRMAKAAEVARRRYRKPSVAASPWLRCITTLSVAFTMAWRIAL